MSAPKCTSWFGHAFKARYSTEPNPPLTIAALGIKTISELTFSEMFETYVRQSQKRTYECDVCVNCGEVVNRNQKSP